MRKISKVKLQLFVVVAKHMFCKSLSQATQVGSHRLEASYITVHLFIPSKMHFQDSPISNFALYNINVLSNENYFSD